MFSSKSILRKEAKAAPMYRQQFLASFIKDKITTVLKFSVSNSAKEARSAVIKTACSPIESSVYATKHFSQGQIAQADSK